MEKAVGLDASVALEVTQDIAPIQHITGEKRLVTEE